MVSWSSDPVQPARPHIPYPISPTDQPVRPSVRYCMNRIPAFVPFWSPTSPVIIRPSGGSCKALAETAMCLDRATIMGRPGGGLRDRLCNQCRPTRLVARAEPGAVIAVEILVEGDQAAPVRVRLEQVDVAENRA